MYHIYHTEGFFLSSLDTKETYKFLSIFTKDFGLIYATVSGVRKSSSKLKSLIYDFAFANIDMVKGRDVWRITSVSRSDVCSFVWGDEKLTLINQRLFLLIRRLCQGEDKNEELFKSLVDFFKFSREIKSLAFDNNDYLALEYLAVLFILNSLGYLGSEIKNQYLTKGFSYSVIKNISQNQIFLTKVINNTLKETHL